MADSKLYTEREVVLRERAAFTRGSTFEMRAWQATLNVSHCSGADSIAERHRRYPLPKISRPRVVRDPHGAEVLWMARNVGGGVVARWIIVWSFGLGDKRFDGALQSRNGYALDVTRERIALWTDLLANPTEEVDDDESVGSSSSQPGEPAP